MWPWLIGLVAALALFACVTLHELGHSAAAMYYGYEGESITLWLLGGVAKPTEIPRNWAQEFWIAVVDERGTLAGLVTRTDLMRAFKDFSTGRPLHDSRRSHDTVSRRGGFDDSR